jgi:hypothetical protein
MKYVQMPFACDVALRLNAHMKKAARKGRQLGVRLSNETIAQIEKRAEAEHRSVSGLLRAIIEEALKPASRKT